MRIPITDDHIHIDPRNGRGLEAAKEFQRTGGTHLMLVSKPSWSFGVVPHDPADFELVFTETLSVAASLRDLGLKVFPVLGVHPAEITRLCEYLPLAEARDLMIGALSRAAVHVQEGRAIALKSGRPHYPVGDEILRASNEVLSHALSLGKECACAVQVHAESGPCEDIIEMARRAGISPARVVKHYAVPETPLIPSFIATHEAIPALCREKRRFTMESDYMDENSRPGAVIGPRSVPRITLRLLEKGLITEEDAIRIHVTTPEEVYGVEIALP
ncbi:MAG: TatD family hydrolase [Methanomicrobiales archaeon]|nr:TatD family hydrolase [Methanomicrobiales archaeon]